MWIWRELKGSTIFNFLGTLYLANVLIIVGFWLMLACSTEKDIPREKRPTREDMIKHLIPGYSAYKLLDHAWNFLPSEDELK